MRVRHTAEKNKGIMRIVRNLPITMTPVEFIRAPSEGHMRLLTTPRIGRIEGGRKVLRAPIIVGLSLALCSQALGLEFWKEGKYVCLTDRAAGLQGEADHRSAGKIELPDNRKRFFLAVERIRNLPKACWN